MTALTSPRATEGRRAALAAAVVGGAYALISAYWALGGRWLLATVGGEFQRLADRGGPAVAAGVWAVVLLKMIACVLPLAATSPDPAGRASRIVRTATTAQAVILTLYGLVLSLVGWLVQAGAVAPGRDADQRTLAWHAFLWDPWFLAWGLLVCVALRCSRGDC